MKMEIKSVLLNKIKTRSDTCLSPMPHSCHILSKQSKLMYKKVIGFLSENIYVWLLYWIRGCTRSFWSENCKWYSFLPPGAVVSLFCESI